MKDNKICVDQPTSEREDNVDTSSLELSPGYSQRNRKNKCSKVAIAGIFVLVLGLVVLAAALIWFDERNQKIELQKQLEDLQNNLEKTKKQNYQLGQHVQQLQAAVSQSKKQDHSNQQQKSIQTPKQPSSPPSSPPSTQPSSPPSSQPSSQPSSPPSSQPSSPSPSPPPSGQPSPVQPQPTDSTPTTPTGDIKQVKNSEGLKPVENKKGGVYVVNEKVAQVGGLQKGHKGTVSAITLLSKNQKNQSIEEVLYKTTELINARKDFQEERKKFLEKYRHYARINLAVFNNKIDHSDDEAEQRQLRTAYQKADEVHRISEYEDELPFCIITPSYKNNARFRIEYNLNSIFTQNYTNYVAVITNDASDDGSDQLYRDYFTFYQIPPSKYIYINNPTKKGAMENDYNANHKYCSEDAISLHLDGDDELIGRNVLKIFNAEYQRRKAGVLYSNFYFYRQNGFVAPGFTSQFPDFVKTQNSYKTHPMRYSHLKSYRTELFRRLDKSNFLDPSGKFFGFASDVAIYLPVMEVACQRVHKIEGYHYLYNTGTGNNQDTISRAKQVQAEHQARAKPKLKCDEEFLKKMQALP